jgi:hypothetical protein
MPYTLRHIQFLNMGFKGKNYKHIKTHLNFSMEKCIECAAYIQCNEVYRVVRRKQKNMQLYNLEHNNI